MSKRLDSILQKTAYLKILLPTLLIISLFVISLFLLLIPQFEADIMERKRETIRELTKATVSMINSWEEQEASGKMSRAEAQAGAIEQVKKLRYGIEDKDYFWVTDYQPIMIVHPYRPDLDGKNLADIEDPHHKKLFVKIVEVVKRDGEGFVDYLWQWKDDTAKIVPKLSYVKGFEPWGWIIGTGIYLDDVKEEIILLETKILNISIFVTLLGTILLLYIAYQNYKSQKGKKEAEDELKASREKFKMLVETSGEGLIMILENQKSYFNKTIFSMIESLDDAIEVNINKLFPGLTYFNSNDSIAAFMNEIKNNSKQIETKLQKVNGKLIDVFVNISPISFENNNGLILSVKDISKNKEIEEELGYSREKYFAVTNQLTIGVFRLTADNDLRIIEFNPALVKLLTDGKENLLYNKSISEFLVDSKEQNKLYDEIKKTELVKNRITQFKKSNGTKITCAVSAVLVKGKNDEVLSIEGIIEDVTEQKETDRQKEELYSDLYNSVIFLNQTIEPYSYEVPSIIYSATVSESFRLMSLHNTDALIIKNNEGEFLGLLTENDLNKIALESNAGLETPSHQIMSVPIETANFDDSIYSCLVKLRNNNSKHLVVKKGNQFTKHLISLEKLIGASQSNFLFFVKKTENAVNINQLKKYKNELEYFIDLLIDNEANIKTVTKFISMISDLVTEKVIKLALEEIGVAPVNFAFITFGSEGREEQTLLSDQDNLIIYDDTDYQEPEKLQKYFLELGIKISNDLNSLGYAHCKGGNSVQNSKWCQPLKVWKRYFTNWITDANPKDILDSKIFFDLRHVFGNINLTNELTNHIFHLTKSSNNFFIYLAEEIENQEISINVNKLKTPFDIKLLLLPLVDLSRVLSLKYNLRVSNTLGRLKELNKIGKLNSSTYSNLKIFYNHLMQLRLLHQLNNKKNKTTVDNILVPIELSELNIVLIKKYLEQIEELKSRTKALFSEDIRS